MPFKLPRSYAKIFSLVFCLGIPSLAYSGNLTITPTYGGQIDDGTIYLAAVYAYQSASKPEVDPTVDGAYFSRNPQTDFTFHAFDMTKGLSDDASLTEAIKFRVKGSKEFTVASGETLVVVVTTTVGSTVKNVPISGIQSACNSTDCLLQTAGESTYYAVRSSTKTISDLQISLHPKDICTVLNLDECEALTTNTGKSILPDNSDPQKTIELTVSVKVTSTGLAPATSVASQEDAVIKLSFHSQGPSFSCPSGSVMENIYYPGDSEILLNTSAFSLSTTTDRAPLSAVVVVAAENPDLPVDTNYTTASSSQLFFEKGLSQEEVLSGFANSSSVATHDYNLLFGVRDMTGLVTLNNSCRISGVRTSSVQSFLKKSKCFIATASFRSMDAGPVEMLREFRDRMLLQTSVGKRFVRWYYRWSEPAASWVLDHPWIRFPILLMLVPVQASVWLAMHYQAFLGFLLIGVFGLFVFASAKKSHRKMGRFSD